MNSLLQTSALIPAEDVAKFPLALQPLFLPKRYKILYGGRGAGRSWGVARALLALNLEKPELTLCARELQKSIQDSVHRILSTQIDKMKMNYLYEIQQAVIKGRPGGKCAGAEFVFEGIRANTDKIKSYEGVKRCWVEEANKTTSQSWKDLIPTIRQDGSEIWATFNPELETDNTYTRFVVSPPGTNPLVTQLIDEAGLPTGGTCTETFGANGAYVIWNSYRDNPWFPSVLRAEMEELRERNYDEYLHVWEGHCKQNLEGAVYADELREATAQGRIRDVPYDRSLGVNVYFDLGKSDNTSMWFEQQSAWEHRFIDFYENNRKDADWYMKIMQDRQYTYDTVWLPHDAFAKRMGAPLTIAAQFREKGFYVREVPGMSIANGINMARTIFPTSYFDKARCSDGLFHLRRYTYEVDPISKQFSTVPLHDEHSDAADAFRYAALGGKVRRRGVAGRAVETAARKILPERGSWGEGHVRGGPSTGWMR